MEDLLFKRVPNSSVEHVAVKRKLKRKNPDSNLIRVVEPERAKQCDKCDRWFKCPTDKMLGWCSKQESYTQRYWKCKE